MGAPRGGAVLARRFTVKQSVCYLRNRRYGYGAIKVAQGIVGCADLAFGDRVEPVLEALIRAGGGQEMVGERRASSGRQHF